MQLYKDRTTKKQIFKTCRRGLKILYEVSFQNSAQQY